MTVSAYACQQPITKSSVPAPSRGCARADNTTSVGGMQFPFAVEAASRSFCTKACIGIAAYAMITATNANLLMVHDMPAQNNSLAVPALYSRYTGTMCLSRAAPDGGAFESSLLGPRYRLTGHKMWISGLEQELSDNIIHMVLIARDPHC